MQMANGNELLNLLEEYAELEWRKYETRNPTFTIRNIIKTEDRSSHPPFTSFRLKNDDGKLIQCLDEAIREYSGEIEWVLERHDRTPLKGTNWCVCPKVMLDTKEKSHYFNVVNQDGKIVYLDGQVGRVVNKSQYRPVAFLPTTHNK